MAGQIYLIHGDEQLVPLIATPYESEALLQRLLAQYPDILAGEQINEAAPRRWLLVAREISVPGEQDGPARWSLDHLFIDQDGVPTLVEVKRSSDNRIRREVVGQMLDYAANAVAYWPIETVRERFLVRCTSEGRDADSVLEEFLETRSPEDFWRDVKDNLQTGKVRMVFVADEIPAELQRVVEFLNQQMDPAEVLAVEVRQFAADKLRTLVPRVFGQTAQAQQKKGVGQFAGKTWNEPQLLEAIEGRGGAPARSVAARIIAWAREHKLREWWGHGAKSGSFYAGLTLHGIQYWPIAIWTYCSVEVEFATLTSRPPFHSEDLRRELLRRLNEIPGLNLPDDSITRRPAINFALLTNPTALASLLNAFDWAFQSIRDYQPESEPVADSVGSGPESRATP